MNRALLVGINSYPTAPLKGCINDITDMAGFLVSKCGFQKSDIRLLVDDRATKVGIIDRLGWLLTGVQPGDRIIFHFSGHGVQLPTRNPQGEVDGLDEVVCPYDFNWTEDTAIRDKEFARIFSTIPKGTLFTWVADCCHSEDLEREMPHIPELKKTIEPPVDIAWRIEVAKEKGIKPMSADDMTAMANVLLVSGCRSNETSADADFNNRYNGALTYFLINSLNNGEYNQPMSAVVDNINTLLQNSRFTQHPTLSGPADLQQRPFLQ